MKKMGLVFMLAFVLVLGFAMTAWAADDVKTKVYFDTWTGGNLNIESKLDVGLSNSSDFDAKSYFLGFETTLDRFKIAGEFSVAGEIKDLNSDVNITNFKIGYNVVDADKLKICGTFGLLIEDVEILPNDSSYTGTMLGADLSYSFSDQFFFQGSLAFSVSASRGDYKSVDMSTYVFKLGYLINENVAFTLGYRSFISKDDCYFKDDDGYYWPGSETFTMDGMTLGMMCKF